jgi:hypothetical protein
MRKRYCFRGSGHRESAHHRPGRGTGRPRERAARCVRRPAVVGHSRGPVGRGEEPTGRRSSPRWRAHPAAVRWPGIAWRSSGRPALRPPDRHPSGRRARNPGDELAAILGPARPTLAALVPELRGAGRDDSAATDGAAAQRRVAARRGLDGTAADRARPTSQRPTPLARPPASSSTSSGARAPCRRCADRPACSKTCSGSIRRPATW